MTTTYVQRVLHEHDRETKVQQQIWARQVEQSRIAHNLPPAREFQPATSLTVSANPHYKIFAQSLGETEDLQAACKRAGIGTEEGERGLRNQQVCAVAEEAHRAACQTLIDELKGQLPIAERAFELLEQAYQKSYQLTGTHKGYGAVYDTEKAIKKMRRMVVHLELRKMRSVWMFNNTKWQVTF